MSKQLFIEKAIATGRINSKAAAEELYACFLESVREAVSIMEVGDDYRIAGLGTFKMKHVPERTGRNPQTGEALTIAARNKLSFKIATDLQKAVNQEG